MNKPVKQFLLIVAGLAGLAVLAVGVALLFLPRPADLLGPILDAPDLTELKPPPPRRVEKVEQLAQSLRGADAAPPAADAAAPSAAPSAGETTWRLTEQEINEQLQYELQRQDLPARGLESAVARLTPDRVDLVCRINGQAVHDHLPADKRDAFPDLLKTTGTLQVRLTPTRDIINRCYVQIESIQMGRLPVPPALVIPFLRKSLPRVEYDPDYGFRLPERLQQIEIGDRTAVVTLKS
ncbi:MAG TPA: hypothetical protein PLY66_02990 [Acidobacteriota bacterium]|nr:hypothetical protein [Acidobacteriota bacterium]HQF85686.1 hypothetical protein [Acidobacteriota bacterium]HQG91070.1 hypothetical protein [Acidobacteriota bacterium]